MSSKSTVHHRHEEETSPERCTPRQFFDDLDEEFGFSIDAAASEDNRLCERYYSQENSGLRNSWQDEIVFCNPPYSKRKGHPEDADAADFIRKAFVEWLKGNCTAVLLLAARPDTIAWHNLIHPWRGVEVRYIKGRLKFVGCKDPAPFPSAVVIFRKEQRPQKWISDAMLYWMMEKDL